MMKAIGWENGIFWCGWKDWLSNEPRQVHSCFKVTRPLGLLQVINRSRCLIPLQSFLPLRTQNTNVCVCSIPFLEGPMCYRSFFISFYNRMPLWMCSHRNVPEYMMWDVHVCVWICNQIIQIYICKCIYLGIYICIFACTN